MDEENCKEIQGHEWYKTEVVITFEMGIGSDVEGKRISKRFLGMPVRYLQRCLLGNPLWYISYICFVSLSLCFNLKFNC